jgi:hypothetical protein
MCLHPSGRIDTELLQRNDAIVDALIVVCLVALGRYLAVFNGTSVFSINPF